VTRVAKPFSKLLVIILPLILNLSSFMLTSRVFLLVARLRIVLQGITETVFAFCTRERSSCVPCRITIGHEESFFNIV
jgi:hypothetical protein